MAGKLLDRIVFNITLLTVLSYSQSAVSNPTHSNDTNILDYTTATSVILGTDSKDIQVANSSYNFLGKSYSKIFANKHGSLAFGKPDVNPPIFGFTCKNSHFYSYAPKIAIFLRSVNQSQLFFENIEFSRTPGVFQSVQEDVSTAFPLFSGKLTKMLVVTWTSVQGQNDPYVNTTFQGVLATDDVNTFVTFSVKLIDSHKCNVKYLQPIAGFHGGFHNSEVHYLIPGSCKSLCYFARNSNIGQRGKYVFKVDKILEHPSKNLQVNHEPQLISLVPRIVPMTGSVPLIAHGIDIVQDFNLIKATCTFQDQNRFLYEYRNKNITNYLDFIRCETPAQFDRLGKIDVFLKLSFADHPELNFQSFVFVEKLLRPTPLLYPPRVLVKDLWMLSFSWDHKNMINSDINDLHLIHTGYNVRQDMIVTITIMHQNSKGWHDVFVLKDAHSWNPVDKFTTHQDGTLANLTGPKCFKVSVRQDPAYFSTPHYLSWTEWAGDVFNTTVAIDSVKPQGDHDKLCQELLDDEELSPTDTLPCPTSLTHAFLDWRFTYNGPEPDVFKFTQNTPSPSGSGAVCSYNWRGNLIVGTKHGSFIQLYSSYNKYTVWKHHNSDYMPYISCCVFENPNEKLCDRFMKKRSVSADYQFPVPFKVGGVNQIVTPEERRFRLNKTGPFWLLKSGNISAQILSEDFSSNADLVTVTTAVALKFTGAKRTTFNVFSASEGLQMWMDDEPVNFYKTEEPGYFKYMRDNFTIYGNEYTAFINGTTSVLFSMSNGLTMKIMPNQKSISLNIIGGFSFNTRFSPFGLLFGFGEGWNEETFMEQWRVSPEEIFLQLPQEDSRRNNRHLISITPEENSSNAVESCLQVKECALDYNLTENAEFALSSLKVHLEFAERRRVLLSNENTTEPHIEVVSTDIVEEMNINRSTTDTFNEENFDHTTFRTVASENINQNTTDQGNNNLSTISTVDEDNPSIYPPEIVKEDDSQTSATDILDEDDKTTNITDAYVMNLMAYLLLGVLSAIIIVIFVIFFQRKISADNGKTENFIVNYAHSFNTQ